MSRNKVSAALHAEVLKRDGMCFMRRVDEAHVCRDTWGEVHDAHDLSKLTVDHVHTDAMMGKRAPSDAAHLVALCAQSNVAGVSREVRQAQREYLAHV